MASTQVSEFWGNERKEYRKHNWLEHPVALEALNVRRAGDPAVGLAEYWRGKFLPTPAPLALSLGCGFGLWERIALPIGLATRIDAVDVSTEAIVAAKKYAAEAGLSERVSYSVADINRSTVPASQYDAIFAISSLHHVEALEDVLRACAAALKPGGLLFVDEYIGPARFQSEPHVVELINELLAILPSKYRHSVYLNGQERTLFGNPPIAWFEQNDPSEAIRSNDIVPVVKEFFDIVDFRPYGGTLQHMLLSGMAGNFDPSSETDTAILRLLSFVEEKLEAHGVLKSDFASIVARPRIGSQHQAL